MAYIYVITNKINGKQYVGQTTYSIEQRFKEHKKQKNKKDRKHFPLYLAFNKYGVENFIISQLEECDDKNLDEREIYWIEKLNTYHNGYNATTGGKGRCKYDKEKIIKELYKTKCIKETSKNVGCSITTVNQIIKAYNLQIDFYNKPKKVLQIDKKTGKELYSFDSYRQAAFFLQDEGLVKNWKDAQRHISEVCRGKRQTCAGFIWKNIE